MLRVAPWNRLPLTIQWLSDDFFRDFPTPPPMHMSIKCGRIKIKKKATNVDSEVLLTQSQGLIKFCFLCDKIIQNPLIEMVTCLQPSCKLVCHIVCLAVHCLKDEPGQVIPVEGICPICDKTFLWGDVIRKQKGCSDIVEDLNNTDAFEVNEVSDEESD